jgi:chromate transporter
MTRVSLARLIEIYARIGNLTFGGGDPTMAVLYSELVVTRRWITAETYVLVYALARITPGTNLLAFCAGTAWEILGWWGAIAAVVGVTLPSAGIVLALSAGYDLLHSNHIAMSAIAGTLAAAVGMMATGAWQMLRPHLAAGRWLRAIVFFAFSVTLSLGLGMSPIQVLGLAAAAGFLWQVPDPK